MLAHFSATNICFCGPKKMCETTFGGYFKKGAWIKESPAMQTQ